MAKRDKTSASAGADEIDAARVRKLAALLDETGLGEIEYATDRWRIRVARGTPTAEPARVARPAAEPAAASAPGPEADAANDANLPGAVKSPFVGTAYLRPAPDQPPFVKLGDEVKEGQPILIIEAMKVMNEVVSPRAGKIARIAVENGAPVEYGSLLMVID
ncbi:MAG TPA: acetyl-CoA carboxylase biotin carboxyl carrier protein subunit [Alphaproteobacteria bacterium]|nr:acetyl-CoA carboxylase biotin carboxyl carrier protein subunit [Alphaproteobacteria bacterium]